MEEDKPAGMVSTLLRRPEEVHAHVRLVSFLGKEKQCSEGCPVEINHTTETYVGKKKAF